MAKIQPFLFLLGALITIAILYVSFEQFGDYTASFSRYLSSPSCTEIVRFPNISSFLSIQPGNSTNSTLSFLDPVQSPPCNCTNSFPPLEKQSDPPPHQWYADKTWHYPGLFPLCSMDVCFNFTRCEGKSELLIYNYDIPSPPVRFFSELKNSPWHTDDPEKACLFLVFSDNDSGPRPHPNTLPFWNNGMNHAIVTFADMWHQRNPPKESIGNASILSSELHETIYRPGFDIAVPLPANHHFRQLQSLPPLQRKYFATFKGKRYLGWSGEGSFRSDPSFRAIHNGRDIIVAVTCKHPTNDAMRRENPEVGEGCDEGEKIYDQYDYADLMNSTFGLAPAGRSPSSYRFIEVLSAGAIPVLICDNYVRPFDTLVHWHKCLLQFPTSEMHRIVPALRSMTEEEIGERQKYCLYVYNEFLKDDKTLVRSVVRSLKARFLGMFPELAQEASNGTRRRLIQNEQGIRFPFLQGVL